MRRAHERVVESFCRKESHRGANNTTSDGRALRLHGNAIAEWRDGELWVTLAGWPTVTTRDRLNLLPGVNVCRANNQQHLNGEPWDGKWTRIA